MKTTKPITPMNVERIGRLEPDCNDDAVVSSAISAKRAADALERIADALAKQNNTATDIFNIVEKL